MDTAPVLQELEIENPVLEEDSTDRESALVEALLGGSREAAESLVDLTYGLIYAALMRLCAGDSALASDLTQETYRKAWASLAKFERRARFSTWLYRIAYNTFLNQTRRANRTTSIDAIPELNLKDARPNQEESLSDREVAARLERVVLDLPDDMRFAISARFWGELPVREIARLEGVSEVAVRKRMQRALAVIRVALNEGTDS